MNKYIFPVVLMALDLGAAVVYGISGDMKKSNILDCCCSIECGGDVLRREADEKYFNRP